MKRKLFTVLMALALLALCLVAFTACGNDCTHPAESLVYHHFGSMTHNVYCNACGTHLPEERCDTPDGACGLCAKCGFEGTHEYAFSGESSENGHTVQCHRCDDIKVVEHSLSTAPTSGGSGVTYHNLELMCYTCGYSHKLLGDHTSESGVWQTDATSHWQTCDDCGKEFSFGIHELVDGACTKCSYAAEALPVSENLEFTLSEDESYYTLTKILVNGEEGAVIILPASYNDKPVKAIGKGGSSYEAALVNGMRSVKALYIPDGVTMVNDYAFGNTNYAVGLVYLRLPETLTYIGDRAFQYADLYELTVPAAPGNANRVIGDFAFFQNDELRSLVIEEGVTVIGDNAFEDCYMLTDISLPSTVADISTVAFGNCDNIKSLTVQSEDGEDSNGNDHYVVVDNCLIERDSMTLLRSDASMKVPAGVKVLLQRSLSGLGRFLGTSVEMHALKLPASLVTVEAGAFDNPSIQSISLTGDSAIFAVGTGCFYNKQTDTLLWGNVDCVIPESVTTIAKFAFNKIAFDSFTVPAHIQSMEDFAFDDCTFTELIIADGVGGLGFSACTTKQDVLTVPGSVKEVDGIGVGGMKKLVLCEGVERIAGGIHVEVVLPTTIKSADQYLRYAQDGINLSMYGGCQYLGDKTNPYYILLGAADGISGTLTLHPDTKVIADKAFSNCRDLTGVVFNDKLAYIGENAFSNTGLAGEIVIPDSVKGIGSSAFYYASGSNFKLTLGNGLEEFGDRMIEVSVYNYDYLTK
ncbi:MAG: leucine-rich repeat domain-containing protein, partial [Clostridia bacterium]|nr:leucine-rich repeat domain-containing protein [Clostridia bacterium]